MASKANSPPRAQPGGSCTNGGNGGFEANGVFNPSPTVQNSDSGGTVAGDGGGGGDGFILLRTKDAAHCMVVSGSVISPPPINWQCHHKLAGH